MVFLLLLSAFASARADEAQSLAEFLDRLGLAELRIHQLERALPQVTAGEERLAAARRLADAYADQLLAAADEPDRFTALQSRVEKLLADFPQARTPAIEVVLLQADYQRAEALVIRWLEGPADRQPLAEAAGILARLAPLLTSHQQSLLAAAEKTIEGVEHVRSEPQRKAIEQQARREQAASARAGYFAGWSHYYLGVARQNPAAARDDFLAAKEQFSRILDVTDERNYAPIEAGGLGLDSVWRARSVIGLGLAELGLARPAAAAAVFRWLDDASVPPVIRDQAPYWQVQGMLNAGLTTDAARLITAAVAGFTSSPSPGKCGLCLAAIRGASALDGTQQQIRQQLIAPAIRGLARMRQFDTLDQLIDKHRLDGVLGADDFCLAWLRGRRQYLAAEKSKSDGDFRAAAGTLAAALALPEAGSALAEAGQARYYLAWCQFRLGDLEPAARSFQEAATALRSAGGDLAVRAAWMRCTCLVQLTAKDKRHRAAAIAALQAFKQDFPSSEEAQRVDLLVTRLRSTAASPEQAIRELAAIGPGDATYLAAQVEICQLQHQLWTKAKTDPAKAAPLAAEVLKTAEHILAAADRNHDERLRATLLAVDVLLAAKEPDRPRARLLLADVAPAAETLDPASPAALEYQYRRLQLAQQSGEANMLAAAAQAIAEHGRGSPYELPALVIVARAADEAVHAAGAVERPARVEEAAGVYSRLVELLGDSPAVLASSKNALAAASKLAQYDEELGNWPQAADRLTRLVQSLPSDRRFLRRAGVANFQAGRFAASLELWRKLLAGLPAGSDEWLEAKNYQLACLLKTDRPTAVKVWEQFKLLYPEVKSATWRDRFEMLEREFH